MDSEGRRLLQRMQQASEGSSLIKVRSTNPARKDPIQEISSALKLTARVATWRSRPPACRELGSGSFATFTAIRRASLRVGRQNFVAPTRTLSEPSDVSQAERFLR
jgi:hypothetical protein